VNCIALKAEQQQQQMLRMAVQKLLFCYMCYVNKQICCVICQFYSLVLVVTTFVCIFPFLSAAVRAVSLVRPVPLFFLFAVLYGLFRNKQR